MERVQVAILITFMFGNFDILVFLPVQLKSIYKFDHIHNLIVNILVYKYQTQRNGGVVISITPEFHPFYPMQQSRRRQCRSCSRVR